jgi:hypothetical protein
MKSTYLKKANSALDAHLERMRQARLRVSDSHMRVPRATVSRRPAAPLATQKADAEASGPEEQHGLVATPPAPEPERIESGRCWTTLPSAHPACSSTAA